MDQFRVKDTKCNTMHLVFGLKVFLAQSRIVVYQPFFGN